MEKIDIIQVEGKEYLIGEDLLSVEDNDASDFGIADENGFLLTTFKNGNIFTKNFSSKNIQEQVGERKSLIFPFELGTISPQNGNNIHNNNHIRTTLLPLSDIVDSIVNGIDTNIFDAPLATIHFYTENQSWQGYTTNVAGFVNGSKFPTFFGYDDNTKYVRIVLFPHNDNQGLIDFSEHQSFHEISFLPPSSGLIGRVEKLENASQSDLNFYWEPDKQPTFDSDESEMGNWNKDNADDFINKNYETLRNLDPIHIKRENIGKDASGIYDMWCYTFTPDDFETTIFITAGVHGDAEPMGFYGCARCMQLIWGNDKKDYYLQMLRAKVRFIVIPLVNPWGFSQHRISYSQGLGANKNNVNLNRDMLVYSNGKYSFNQDMQAETSHILSSIDRYKDEIDVYYDFHTIPMNQDFGLNLLIYPNGVPYFFSNSLARISSYLYRKRIGEVIHPIIRGYVGSCDDYPDNSSSHVDTWINNDYNRSNNNLSNTNAIWMFYKIPCSTVEFAELTFSNSKGTEKDMEVAIEMYMNHLINPVISDFKEKFKNWLERYCIKNSVCGRLSTIKQSSVGNIPCKTRLAVPYYDVVLRGSDGVIHTKQCNVDGSFEIMLPDDTYTIIADGYTFANPHQETFTVDGKPKMLGDITLTKV